MAINHARMCEACKQECPNWADRCPACGSLSLVRQVIISPPAPVRAVRAKPPRTASNHRQEAASREPMRTRGAPIHSTV